MAAAIAVISAMPVSSQATAANGHSDKSLHMYSHALRALVELRQQVLAEERADS
ncbi:hypothetical protein [Streptomyces sp. NWU339]|uniref:hypothetical protein n=1 Tax=Streptomyces sp. NWU339 TaxID=2185284 RepID=UPI0015E82127|nr:hypothetical protein [Streptomyces sp. NWU339]